MEKGTFSPIALGNFSEVEAQYQRYREDSESVDSSLATFFQGFDLGLSVSSGPVAGNSGPDLRVYCLVMAYRRYGHLYADMNPLVTRGELPIELQLKTYQLSDADLGLSFPTFGALKEERAPLSQLIAALQKSYCGSVGVEYMDLSIEGFEGWMMERLAQGLGEGLDKETKLELMKGLFEAEFFESFLQIKHVGQKRFSLEGGETLIPLLREGIATGSAFGISEVFIGMAHRGRLNVLANVMNKPYKEIFAEFEEYYSQELSEGVGDVKYHKGFVSEVAGEKPVRTSLAPNPSHLESVDPVVLGLARAAQDKSGVAKSVLPILIHGDAAVAGQGVVYETLQFAKLKGYCTSGTIHIVVNNQIGFTATPDSSRSTRYCTAIAKAFNAPVFHINSDEPAAAVEAMKLAIETRQKFGCDVFIDLICYRKYGHNEGDEPSFTQPLEYVKIRSKQSVCKQYQEKLLAQGLLSAEFLTEKETAFKARLQTAFEHAKIPPVVQLAPKNENYGSLASAIPTGKSGKKMSELTAVAKEFSAILEDTTITLHPNVKKVLQTRLEMVSTPESKVNWATAEHLAFATLLKEGIDVRLSGQDSGRGTFSQRHSLLYDQKTGKRLCPLANLGPGKFQVYDSPLSEFAVLGFEFGYSTLPATKNRSLVIWEAQYGDFGNGAQIIIDQYLGVSEQRWGVTTNLTLMLPHGYVGGGAEHSSARIERFLQLCGDENMRVANCSRPAQLFHLLRLQVLSELKKPLVLFTPKEMLRHPRFVSPFKALEQEQFYPVLDDDTEVKKPRIVIFCSGKIYYEIDEQRVAKGRTDMAIIRIELLYPLDRAAIEKLVKKYAGFERCLWVQEEHENMGAWNYIRPELEKLLNDKVTYCGRVSSAVPAAGSYNLHKKQAAALMNELFNY